MIVWASVTKREKCMKNEFFEHQTDEETKTENEKNETVYQHEGPKPWYLLEPAVAYDVTRKRGQGDYTLDDYYRLASPYFIGKNSTSKSTVSWVCSSTVIVGTPSPS